MFDTAIFRTQHNQLATRAVHCGIVGLLSLIDGHLAIVVAMHDQQRAGDFPGDALQRETMHLGGDLFPGSAAEYPLDVIIEMRHRDCVCFTLPCAEGQDLVDIKHCAVCNTEFEPFFESGCPWRVVSTQTYAVDSDAGRINFGAFFEIVDTRRGGAFGFDFGWQSVQAQSAAGAGLIDEETGKAAPRPIVSRGQVKELLQFCRRKWLPAHPGQQMKGLAMRRVS